MEGPNQAAGVSLAGGIDIMVGNMMDSLSNSAAPKAITSGVPTSAEQRRILPKECKTDAAGNVYVCGETESSGWGISGGWDTSYGRGDDGFVVKINDDTEAPEASLESSTVVGASNATFSLTYMDNAAIDSSTIGTGDVLVAGPNSYSQYAAFISIDDGSDGTPRTATYRVTSPDAEWVKNDNGTYQIAMVANQVSDTSGNFVAAGVIGTFTIAIPNQLPTADAGGPYTVDEGSSVTLSAAGSNDTDGTIVTYLWDLDNDGQYDDATGVTASFSRNVSGSYTVRVKVTDDNGDVDTDSTTVTVNNVAPTANAGGPYEGNQGDAITLSAASSTDSGNDIVSYLWDLDNDGQYDDATGVTTSYNASTVGTFTVAVKVTDNDGASDTDSTDVTVLASNPVSGDANFDGKVDGSDVTILAGNWQAGVTGDPNATWSMGDFNGDGKVDGSDVTILAGNWQTGVTSAVVAVSNPEPEPNHHFTPPVTASLGVATVPRRESLPPRRFITHKTTDAAFAESTWSENNYTAIAKDLTSVSAKKSTAASDELFALELDPYADLD